ncbi:MAG: hypothetical protein LQ350_000866 [Teloschistes chrysophthalmus]|nr:MAG: hypothetical protein LQ350_000866 [Niorma chrysophthalma]
MASSQGNRAKFISGLMQFMSTYGFDGVDLDWEYPGADDRGGVKEDTANYVLLAQELKAAFGSKYGISMTLPTSYWYLQHFDLPGIQQHIDWFNLMAYDLHGVWDKDSKFVGPYLAPHTNITEIDLGMDLLWRSGVTPDRVVLGQGLYGRSFTLADPSCNTPNGVCRFSGPANAGPCSNAAGILDKQEIDDIISENHLQPTWAHAEAVKWITWDSNQWVSYDDADTFKQKRDFANSRCLGGLMVWAMDQVDQKSSNDLGVNGNVTPDQQGNANQMASDQLAGTTCRSAPCGSKCPKGSSQVTESNGQPGQLSTSEKCPKGKHQPLCCDHGTTMGKCQWRGFRGAGLSCISGCADGETEVTTNKNNHGKKGDQTCNGGVQSYCCAGFKPAPTKDQLAKEAKDAAKATAESAAEQAALDVAAKAFCRIAVPALLAPLELLEDLIPIFGEIADIAEIAATPAIIQGCVKGIEKEGKAEFKVFGKKHTLSMDKPSEKPTEIRPPATSHETPKTSTQSNACNLKARDLEKRVGGCNDVTNYIGTTTLYQTVPKPLTIVVVMSMSFDMDGLPLAQERDDGLSANECYPQMLVNDPGFALLNRDPYVLAHGVNAAWANPPSAQLINGRNPPFRKRDLNPYEYVLEDRNSSRRLGPEDLDQLTEAVALDEHLRMLDEQIKEVKAYVDCVGDDCATSTTLVSGYVLPS